MNNMVMGHRGTAKHQCSSLGRASAARSHGHGTRPASQGLRESGTLSTVYRKQRLSGAERAWVDQGAELRTGGQHQASDTAEHAGDDVHGQDAATIINRFSVDQEKGTRETEKWQKFGENTVPACDEVQ